MRTRAVWSTQTTAVRVRDVALVIWGIEVLAVPARREDDSRSNSTRTVLVGQLRSVLCITRRKAFTILQASVADACLVGLLGHGIARNHAKPWLEGCHLIVLGRVRHVVYRHTAILLEPYVGELWHTLESTVLGGFEVQRGSPVVAEVLAIRAGCTG